MTESWPWAVLAGLGMFHGLNPAMGWLFAVALGLHRQRRGAVWMSLVPIAVGHALSIGVVAAIFAAASIAVAPDSLRAGAGLLLLAWAAFHWRFGHRHRVRIGMQAGLLGLAAWSFLMATAHGAGLMLWPALIPLCSPAGLAAGGFAQPWAPALAGVGVHTLAMLVTTATIAVLVYEWTGLAILRKAWINLDVIWIGALVATAIILLLGYF
jgi:hypothetical protein